MSHQCCQFLGSETQQSIPACLGTRFLARVEQALAVYSEGDILTDKSLAHNFYQNRICGSSHFEEVNHFALCMPELFPSLLHQLCPVAIMMRKSRLNGTSSTRPPKSPGELIPQPLGLSLNHF